MSGSADLDFVRHHLKLLHSDFERHRPRKDVPRTIKPISQNDAGSALVIVSSNQLKPLKIAGVETAYQVMVSF